MFNDREALGWLEELLHPLVSLEYLQWREHLAGLPDAPAVCVTEVPLLYETGGDARFDKVVVITAPEKLRRARSIVATRTAKAGLLPDSGESEARRFRVQEHRLARAARRVRRVGDARARRVRRLVWVLLLAVVGVGAFAYVNETSPPWYERIRYPLRYSEYVRVHAPEHGLDPSLVAAVIYQESKFRSDAKSSSGAIGLMQITPATARGIAIRTHGSAFHTHRPLQP